jgi:hypothetical protein
MINMKVKFITAIYTKLYGTDLGGRPSRGGHYKYSLLSLLKMDSADFLCYTSDDEIEDLEDFFYTQNNVSKDKLKFKIFDLYKSKFSDLINKYKNVEDTIKSDRCIEIQYSKFHWWWDEDKTYDYYFWIDAGLSHVGLIPEKYLTLKDNSFQRYFESNLFNNVFLENLITETNNKFLIIGKENDRNYWSGTVDPKWYTNYNRSVHIIGGLFGGHKDNWDNIVNLFEKYTYDIINEDKILYHEEVIMSLMYFNHIDLFERKHFDIWYYPGNTPQGVNDEIFIDNKCFYKILEEINKINE